MYGENIPNSLYIFLGIYTILILILSIFIQRYFVRKGTNIFINIFCIFLWFCIIMMMLIFPLDLFSNFLFQNDDKNKNNTKIFSACLYWLFYICGFLIVDQLRSYISNGNFTFITKIISIIKFMAIFLIIFVGFGFVIDLILRLCIYLFGENNALSIALKIISTIINAPMLIAYLMFLGCGLWNLPKDLFIKFYYPLRIRKLCWEITHVMRKYRDETEFIIISINKIKLTQEKIKNVNIKDLENEIKEAKEKMNLEKDKELRKGKKKIYDNLNGFKELYKCEKEINEIIENLKKTANIFGLNINIESSNNVVEIKELKNKDELIDINTKYKIYCGQIFRLNYQKYSIYKEWAEIKTFNLLNKNDLPLNQNKNDITYQYESNKKNQIDKSENIVIKEKEKMNIIIHDNNQNINNGILENSENRKIKKNQNNNNDLFEFKKLNLAKKTIIYYKIMPKINIIFILICIAYDILIIFGEVEYTFKWELFAGKFLRWFFTNTYIITPIRIFPMYFTLFVVSYDFSSINSDITFCVFGNHQTEQCHMLFFVGMLTKFICPLCFNFIEIMYNGIDLKGNNSKITVYFEDQFGYLNEDNENVVIFIVKIALLFLFLKAIVCSASNCYGNFAYKKHQYLTFNSNYEDKESEIMMGELILNNMNKNYGDNLEKLKGDNIFEYIDKK